VTFSSGQKNEGVPAGFRRVLVRVIFAVLGTVFFRLAIGMVFSIQDKDTHGV
jgi:hypothetical protein